MTIYMICVLQNIYSYISSLYQHLDINKVIFIIIVSDLLLLLHNSAFGEPWFDVTRDAGYV